MKYWRFSLAALLLVLCLTDRSYVNADIIRRCIRCRSRGDLGSCKDPFTLNSTQIEQERGVEAVPCASNWCVKIIESQSIHNEYGTATERNCLGRGPDDNEERCAYTKWNNKNVYMCFCKGDLCNGSSTIALSRSLLAFLAGAFTLRWLLLS
ncbi:hypothetical protein TKK_0002778 [Trichogramma kaykai]